MVKIFLKPSLHKAKSQSAKTYTESTLFSVLSLDKLLPDIEKTHYLHNIQEIVQLPDDYFKCIYGGLIDNFARYVQILPELYGEELGGLLNDGLRRALLAIRILTETQSSKPHPLYVFAIFSIALLSDIGQILNYRVMISDEKGAFIDDWYPHLGSVDEFGDYYKLRPYEGVPTSLIKAATPLLARQLLSETAITWLSSNDQIFDMWLAYLNKGDDWEGGLWKLLKIDPRQYEHRVGEVDLFPIDIKAFDPLGTELGEKFLAWLKEGLKEGTISFNTADSNVHLIKTNESELSVFLQTPELFQQFCNVYTQIRDWVVVCQQFNALGLTELSGYDFKIKQFFSDTPEKKSRKLNFLAKEKLSEQTTAKTKLASRMAAAARSIKEGLVIKDAKVLFGANVPAASQYLGNQEMRFKNEQLPKLRTEGGHIIPQDILKV
jgi:hypothetical protein